MANTFSIEEENISRVEGHGDLVLNVKDKQIEKLQFRIPESPRFFEAMLVGKNFENAPYITGRICGICSIGHTLASIRAVENAFAFTPSRQTRDLRLLLKHMETLQSHILHLYFLVTPDFLNTGSIFPLAESHPEEFNRAVRLKMLANDACDLIGGRRLHPTRTVVGGFTMLPEKAELSALKNRLEAAKKDLARTAELFSSFSLPDFVRETEFVSLKGEGSYPFIGGDLVSSDGVVKNEDQYLEMTNEYVVDHSTSKWSRLSRDSLAAGALARFNNNFSYLHPAARELAEGLSLKPGVHNPFLNNTAQLVECVHIIHESTALLGELIDRRRKKSRTAVSPRKGYGVGAVEVPRGILYHAFDFDESGRIMMADCVIPTSQNHANIHYDLQELVRQSVVTGRNDKEIRKLAEMLVRAYDPCISCSVH